MKRDLAITLKQWKDQPDRLPLLLRGARQDGQRMTSIGPIGITTVVVTIQRN